MNKFLKMAFAGLVLGVSGFANAGLINTTTSWGGSINNGWSGSGQSLTVDASDTYFEYISFYFGAESEGRTFDFVLSDAISGGSTLFSSSFAVNSGEGTININTALTAGSVVYALINYNGFMGDTAHFINSNVYSGGNSFFLDTTWMPYGSFDHSFTASFSQGISQNVPGPPTLAILALGLMGLASRRFKKQS
jgi:hypothetical protein